MSGANKEEKKSAFICLSNLTLPLFLRTNTPLDTSRLMSISSTGGWAATGQRPSIQRRGRRFEFRIKVLCTCPEFNEKHRKLKRTRPRRKCAHVPVLGCYQRYWFWNAWAGVCVSEAWVWACACVCVCVSCSRLWVLIEVIQRNLSTSSRNPRTHIDHSP